MKTIIYYFSGTGNSLRAAMRIGEILGGAKLISVKNRPEEESAEDADVIGFVCPTYEWDVPEPMKEFVSRIEVNPKAYFFMVSTYILIHGRSFETIEKLLAVKGAQLNYGCGLQCVASQATAYTPFPPLGIMLPKMERKIKKIGKQVRARVQKKYPHMSPITRSLYDRMMQPFMDVQQYYDKGFYTADACRGCGLCQEICPLGNITMKEKHPKWNQQCIGCMACVSYCPNQAIRFQPPKEYVDTGMALAKKLRLTEKNKTYHHPYIKSTDMIKGKHNF